MSTQKTWNRLFIISLELNPLLTLPGIQTDFYPTFLFYSIPTFLLCLYVIHVDLIEPFCRFQLNIQLTACCFEVHVLGWFGVDFYHKSTRYPRKISKKLEQKRSDRKANVKRRQDRDRKKSADRGKFPHLSKKDIISKIKK